MQALLALLPGIISGIPAVIKWITDIRMAAQQTGEWTLEIETQFQAMLAATNSQPQWQPDKD
jgi:hypothetical protein